METKNFKALFSTVAERNGFAPAHGGWFYESPETIIVLDLQKSNFGNYFEMNFKIFVQGLFGKTYARSKELIKKDTGDVFRRAPKEFDDIFNLDFQIDRAGREKRLVDFFNDFVVPLAMQSRTRLGLQKLADAGNIFLLPAVKQELKNSIE